MKMKLLIAGLLLTAAASAQNLLKTMTFEGQSRSYRIYIPSAYDGSHPVPLLLALHGLGDNANNFQGVGFNAIADTANFIAVYPNALTGGILPGTAWNTRIYPGNNNDDVGFLNALIDSILIEYSIDTNRIYSTGFSLGGFMTYRLACEIGSRLAAVASVAGSQPAPSIAGCNPGHAMPVLHIHGTTDQTIPYTPGTLYVVVTNLGADSTARYWAQKNGCNPEPSHDMLPDSKQDGLTFEKFSYTSCSDQSEVILIKANGMAHTWPFSSNDISASNEIWNFFSRHQKSASLVSVRRTIPFDFSVFPNPSSGSIIVKSSLTGELKAVLTDFTGKKVFSGNFSVPSFSIPIENIISGVYQLTVISGTASATKKVVIGK